MIGGTLSHYEILERLGAGTLGTVYKARDFDLDRIVVLRVLPPELFASPETRERVARDLATAGTLDHPNVCPVWDVEEMESGGVLASLALCEGETLADRLDRGPLRPATVADLGTQIAAGLARAHAAGLVHGYLHAGNVVLTADGQAKILDLGLAGLRAASGEDGLRGDLGALGGLLRDMLPPDSPAELQKIVERALSGRFSGAEEMRQALRALRGSGTRPTLVPASPAADQPTLREIPAVAFPASGAMRLPRDVGPYRLREQLGGGGMGIIYKAEDTRLGRTVALKFLPPELTRDPVAKARFSQEARAASALDHPNICTIYDLGETAESALFLSMPCYEGETLRDLLERGPLPLEKAADIARQVALGLAKAHRQGIVHRDIKPANLMITSDGVVKILDFGIAKLAGAAAITRTGVALGTPAYMAPEQIRGDEVDLRADLWSLGVVLYEMLAGRRPFPDENEVLAFHAILFQEPSPLGGHRPDVPPELEQLIAGLLRKNPAERTPTAEAVLEELLPLTGTTSLTSKGAPRAIPPAPAPRRSRWVVLALGLAAVLALLGVLLWRTGRSDFDTVPPFTSNRVTEQGGVERFPSLAPRDDFFVYASQADGDWDLYLQRPGGNPINLTESSPADDTQPAYSPDGDQIVFRSEREGGGLFLMGATGESVRRLTDAGYNPVWSPDGKEILFATDQVEDPRTRSARSQIWRIDLATMEKHLVVPEDAAQPSWSPGGKRIAFWSVAPDSSRRVIWTVAAAGGKPVPVTQDAYLNWNPVWSPDGRFLYFASNRSGSMDLWRVPIDEETGKLRGDPVPLRVPTAWAGPMAISRDGRRIVYSTLDEKTNLARVALDLGPRASGDLVPVTQGSRFVGAARVSPDGTWIAFRTSAPQEDLFVVHPDGTGLRQLSDDPAHDRGPVWLPDGRILFFSDQSGRYEAWAIHPDGSGREQLTATTGAPIYSPLGSPDGRRLVCNVGFKDLGLIDLTQPREKRAPVLLPRLAGSSFFPSSWSRDGSRLAGSDPQGRLVLFTFATAQYEVLPVFGYEPVWMRDGRLLFRGQDGIYVLDPAGRQTRQVLATPVGSSFGAFDLSPDERSLFLAHETREGDLWMLTMQAESR
ncbi:MAG TPA: protein kinase [Thermoanaerobaculia bacterium]|nr:protein kinase [Thermoanaerobaculia bacterium]